MKRAVFAGTFDPVTVGHEEIISKAASLFDELTVALCVNPVKRATFSTDERLAMLRAVCGKYANVKVAYHEGLLVDFMKQNDLVVNVRGIRNSTDLKYENEMNYFNTRLMPSLVTVYIPCGLALSFVSSSAVRDLLSLGQDVSDYVPAECVRLLKDRAADKKA